MLQLTASTYGSIVAHAYDGLPMEACGLLGGLAGAATATATATATASVFYATGNDAHSTKVYTVPPKEHLHAERDAEDRGLEIIGVVHSHTHTDAYPSPTDIASAPDPSWHYLIVSLRDEAPTMRSYLIVNGNITEEPVVVAG